MKFMLLPILLLTSQVILAAQYQGKITLTKSRLFITESVENKKYLLLSSTPIIATYLNKLATGDFVSIDGSVSEKEGTLTVSSINYVGLKDLLGKWSSDDELCYIFSTHTDFSVSAKLGRRCQNTQTSQYTYLLNPNSNQWVMLVAGPHDSYIGDVEIINKNLVKIDLYDSETGEIVRQLRLKKLNSE